jgi:hypothetical protein
LSGVIANPIQGTFKNLTVGNVSVPGFTAPSSGIIAVGIQADAIMLSDADFNTVSVTNPNLTITLNSSAGPNSIDSTGAAGFTTGTWYSIWAIYNPTTITPAGLASTSSTAPTLPSGYTHKARVGWVRTGQTSTGFAVAQLFPTIQQGRDVYYLPQVFNTSTGALFGQPIIGLSSQSTAGFNNGNPVLSAVSISTAVPPTASHFHGYMTNRYVGNGSASVGFAPSTTFSGTNNGMIGTNGYAWFAAMSNDAGNETWFSPFTMPIYSLTCGFMTNGPGGAVLGMGWRDQIT